MSKKSNIECPCCLGTGEEIYKGKFPKSCSLCKGEGNVDSVLAEDYIASINVIYIEEDDFTNFKY